jgi:ATP-dependent RNA circularization protein (DNA/RNA ligase family)
VSESTFFRFPHTPHLAWLGNTPPRDDKLLSRIEVEELLAYPVTVEEKLDGANLGISVSAFGDLLFQNRGQYLQKPYLGQFARLEAWLSTKADALFDALNQDLLVFGEWCAARHSLDYDKLPDWWMVFDVYDRKVGRFWNASRRDAWISMHGLCTVPTLTQGHFTLQDLVQVVVEHPSCYRQGPLEGIVVRANGAEWTDSRAKLVRADFVQSIEEHWRHRPLQWNRVADHR